MSSAPSPLLARCSRICVPSTPALSPSSGLCTLGGHPPWFRCTVLQREHSKVGTLTKLAFSVLTQGLLTSRQAIVDGLAAEVAPFNIRTIDFEPGFFHTSLTDLTKLVQYAPTGQQLDAYAGHRAAMVPVAKAIDGNERGDVQKGVELMVDVIRGEGCASGRKIPPRLPIGDDAVRVIESTCHNMLKVIDAWRSDVVGTTDRDEFESEKGIEPVVTVPDVQL